MTPRIILLLALLLCGCASGPPYNSEHRYVVTLRGAPVDTLTVAFMTGDNTCAKAYDAHWRVVAFYNGPGYAFKEVR